MKKQDRHYEVAPGLLIMPGIFLGIASLGWLLRSAEWNSLAAVAFTAAVAMVGIGICMTATGK